VDLHDGVVHTSPLLEAYTEFDYLRDFTVRAGQFKIPYDRLRMTSDMRRQLVDFSTVTGEFSLDRDTGVEVRSDDLFGLDLLKYSVFAFSGDGRNSSVADTGFLYGARAEVLPLGLFNDYSEADLSRGGPRLSLGAAYVRDLNAPRDRGTLGNTPADGGTTNLTMLVADGTFKWAGFSAIGSFYSRTGDRKPGNAVTAAGNPVPVAPSRDGTGYVAQAGYMIPTTPLEVAGRYGVINGKTEVGHNGLKDSGELGGGLNYYFAEHELKLQTDFFRIYSGGDLSKGYNQIRLQLQFVL
jgi:hypothetical protein